MGQDREACCTSLSHLILVKGSEFISQPTSIIIPIGDWLILIRLSQATIKIDVHKNEVKLNKRV